MRYSTENIDNTREGQIASGATPPHAKRSVVDKRTQWFLDTLKRNELRCTTPALQPVHVTSLEKMLVLIADKHDNFHIHEDMKTFFMGNRHSDSVLTEAGGAATFESCGTVRSIDDPDIASHIKAKLELSIKLTVELLSWLNRNAPVKGPNSPWESIFEQLKRDLREKPVVPLLSAVEEQILSLRSHWETLPEALLIEKRIRDAASVRYQVLGFSPARNKYMARQLREELDRLRTADTGTTFAYLGTQHTENIRDHFAQEPDVILVEPKEFGVPRQLLRDPKED